MLSSLGRNYTLDCDTAVLLWARNLSKDELLQQTLACTKKGRRHPDVEYAHIHKLYQKQLCASNLQHIEYSATALD